MADRHPYPFLWMIDLSRLVDIYDSVTPDGQAIVVLLSDGSHLVFTGQALKLEWRPARSERPPPRKDEE